MFNDLLEMFNSLHQLSGYIARQTNPITGAPLPQPLVGGVGSAAVPEPPPTSGAQGQGQSTSGL